MLRWSAPQIKLLSKQYVGPAEIDLQEVGAFLDEPLYPYLVASLNLKATSKKKRYADCYGNVLFKNKVLPGFKKSHNTNLSILSKEEAVKDSTDIGILQFVDEEECEVIMTYNSDTLIRAYLNDEPIPPLLIGYDILMGFMNNLNTTGYVLFNECQNHLGLKFCSGIMGKTINTESLREILNEAT